MKKGISKFTAFCVAAGMTLGGPTIVSYATGTELPLVGVKGAGSQSVDTSEKAGDASQQTAEAVQETEDTVTEEYQTVGAEPADTSMVGTRGFAKCSEYINIRAAADTENGEVIGKLRNNAAVYIEDVTADGWYKVSSGNVEGYVAAQYIATGAQAEATAQEAGYHVAEVGAEVLNVRSSADTGSDIVAVVGNSEHIEVVEDCGEWLKVAVDANTYGYVSADYVYAETQYAQAESIEEEQARLNAEYEAYLAQQAAAQQQYTYVETYNDYSAGDYAVYTEPAADASYSASSTAQAAADAAYQEYLNAQAAADAATMQADVQAVYDTAQAAQEKYAEYLTVQAAADAQAAGGSYTETQQTYTETYADQTYYDTTSSSGSQATADALYQEYLDAQAAADAATTQADEQVVYDTAREAQEKYAEYLAAQTAADEAAVNGGSAVITAPDVYAEEFSEEVYSEDTYYEEEYSEEEYVEDGDYVEEYVEDTASYSSTGSDIASFACQFVGNPYVWGGTSLTNGADCSGFTQSVMAHFGIGISRTAASQSGGGTPVDLGSIQPGDLLFYNGDGGIGHVSIYIGNGQVVHASNSTSGIIISDYSYRSPCCARRYW